MWSVIPPPPASSPQGPPRLRDFSMSSGDLNFFFLFAQRRWMTDSRLKGAKGCMVSQLVPNWKHSSGVGPQLETLQWQQHWLLNLLSKCCTDVDFFPSFIYHETATQHVLSRAQYLEVESDNWKDLHCGCCGDFCLEGWQGTWTVTESRDSQSSARNWHCGPPAHHLWGICGRRWSDCRGLGALPRPGAAGWPWVPTVMLRTDTGQGTGGTRCSLTGYWAHLNGSAHLMAGENWANQRLHSSTRWLDEKHREQNHHGPLRVHQSHFF